MGQFNILEWVTPSDADRIRQSMYRIRFAAGRYIYSQGDTGTCMYRIVSGQVQLARCQFNGKEVTFLRFGPDDFFGASSLVDGEPRPQSAICFTDVDLDVLTFPAYQTLRLECPSFTDGIMRLLARQMRVMSAYYTRASADTLAARVADRILELVRDRSSQSATPAIPLVQSDLAAMVGVSRQSVNKVLQKMQREGMVAIHNRTIVVSDHAGLVKLAATM